MLSERIGKIYTMADREKDQEWILQKVAKDITALTQKQVAALKEVTNEIDDDLRI
jgi:hypothetical protein